MELWIDKQNEIVNPRAVISAEFRPSKTGLDSAAILFHLRPGVYDYDSAVLAENFRIGGSLDRIRTLWNKIRPRLSRSVVVPVAVVDRICTWKSQ